MGPRPRPAERAEPARGWAGEPLFVYGSLSVPEVLRVLLGREAPSSPAAVAGWRAAALRDRVFPGLVPAPNRRAEGLLVEGLGADEWWLIDEFEAPWYDLRLLALSHGRQGWAYVCGPQAPVEPHDWDRSAFAARDLATYVRRCAEWRRRRLRAAPSEPRRSPRPGSGPPPATAPPRSRSECRRP